MVDYENKLRNAKMELESLKERINHIRRSKYNGKLETVSREGLPPISAEFAENRIKVRRILQGHFGKVYDLNWSGDSIHIVSASQDGKLIVWNSRMSTKTAYIPLKSCWVMSCAFEQTENRLIASGGLDNICSIYELGQEFISKPKRELSGHQGYISGCRFTSSSTVLTCSGDSAIYLWNIDRSNPICRYQSHQADVISMAVSPINSNIFITGSCDATCKLWDARLPNSIFTFSCHESDVNSVNFFPDGNAIGTGSDDTFCKIIDIRCLDEVASLGVPNLMSGVQSVSFSRSGRLMFAGYHDYSIRVWDISDNCGDSSSIKQNSKGSSSPTAGLLSDNNNKRVRPSFQLNGHTNRISCLAVNNEGDCLMSGSWDTLIKAWA
eukprot:gene8079-10943_t